MTLEVPPYTPIFPEPTKLIEQLQQKAKEQATFFEVFTTMASTSLPQKATSLKVDKKVLVDKPEEREDIKKSKAIKEQRSCSQRIHPNKERDQRIRGCTNSRN